MTPAARLSAAIDILDEILAGAPAERVLTTWARTHRFAGSGDRNAIRDHVFDALRCRGSYAALGGAGGRGLILGLVRAAGQDAADFFTGGQYAPAPLTDAEVALVGQPDPVQDWPEWMRDRLQADLGAGYGATTALMRQRAPVFLRVNVARQSVAQTQVVLAAEGVQTQTHPLASTALQVTDGARKIAGSAAYRDGLVELQDVASQAAVELIPVQSEARVLDYCAGGGGKALALAALNPSARLTAHDIDAARMGDLPERAKRAGVRIERASPGAVRGEYDVVVVDAPCSGSGTWRRSPHAKWRLTPDRLDELVQLQATVLDQASRFLAADGVLVYLTCSLFRAENEDRVRAQSDAGWQVDLQKRFGLEEGGDGFFAAILRRG